MSVLTTVSPRPQRGWRDAAARLPALYLTILALFFVSGAAGLLYQVVWTRKLVLLFGATSFAVSTILSIFFLGLGAGSLLGGWLADRTDRPLRWFGVAEIIIGLWAIAFILVVGYGESLIVGILRAFELDRAMGIGLRALLATALLIVPVTLMGATLPLLAKFVTREVNFRGLRIGSLYSLNTFGAVAGCALTGFVLLAALGYTRTTLVGAAGDILVGLGALALASRFEPAPPFPEEPPTDPMRALDPAPETAFPHRSVEVLVLITFALSGFCALALEVVWTRLLTLVFIGTTYAYTTMLTTLLCGIALGSIAAAPLADRARHPVSLFGILVALTGGACILMLAVFDWMPEQFRGILQAAGFRWEALVRGQFWMAFAALFIPTFLFGATFPAVLRAIAMVRAGLGRRVGVLYSFNTFGGVMGAIAGGFLLIPMLGTHWSIVALGLALAAAGLLLVWTCPTRALAQKTALTGAAAAVLVAAYYVMPADIGRSINDWYIPDDETVIAYEEGTEATVLVSEPRDKVTGSDRVLWINAVQATASIEKGVKMNRLQGILPLVFDRDPETALFMGFGSGVTAGMLGLSEFDRIDAVEISPEVYSVAPLFARDNLDVMGNPRFEFLVDDGRNHLLTTHETYDVITFEPMPLALQGVSTFYTREYYELCLRRLNPGGIVSQWVPLHSLNPGIVRSLLYTFTEVFPHYTLWFVNADLFILGSDEPLAIDYDRFKERLAVPEVNAALAEVDLHEPIELLGCFFMDEDNVRAYVEGGHIMVDDRPWAEFIAPRLMYERHVTEALQQLEPYYQSANAILRFPEREEDEAEAIRVAVQRRHASRQQGLQGLKQYYGGGFGDRPEEAFQAALEIDPENRDAQYYLKEIGVNRARQYRRWSEYEEAIAYLTDLLEDVWHHPELHLELADAYYELGRLEHAQRRYAIYVELGGVVEYAHERAAGNWPDTEN